MIGVQPPSVFWSELCVNIQMVTIWKTSLATAKLPQADQMAVDGLYRSGEDKGSSPLFRPPATKMLPLASRDIWNNALGSERLAVAFQVLVLGSYSSASDYH